jgi:hypothetical protein
VRGYRNNDDACKKFFAKLINFFFSCKEYKEDHKRVEKCVLKNEKGACWQCYLFCQKHR